MVEQKKKCLSVCTHSEGHTALGQVIEFSTHPDDVQKIKEMLAIVRTIDVPVTGRVNVQHGGCGMYTRYQITQHEYSGGGPGYIEVLEINDPPDGRCGVVLHCYSAYEGSDFFEFDSMKNAKLAWKVCWGSRDKYEKIKEQKGFLRDVCCGGWTPWFYAVGDQLIEGDVVFMDIDREDAEFRFGQKYVVWDEEGLPAVKKCMGTHRSNKDSECKACNHIGGLLVVFWHDGTWWRSDKSWKNPKPRLIEENELWIWEAVNNFKELLSGKSREFSIAFLDGSKFIGKWSPENKKARHAEGRYYGKITLKGGEVKEGEFDFKPTAEAPTVEDMLRKQAIENDLEVEKIEVVKFIKPSGKRKKWLGIYPPPNAE
jgi:hypothetical protein